MCLNLMTIFLTFYKSMMVAAIVMGWDAAMAEVRVMGCGDCGSSDGMR